VKLYDRHPVEGTSPLVYIGHRPFKNKGGQRKISKTYFYEYNHEGRKHSGPLKTSNKQAAIKAAWALVQRIERGEGQPVRRRIEWEEFTKEYINLKRNKNRAPKTIEKYELVLGQLATFSQEAGRRDPKDFKASDYWAFNGKMTKDGLEGKTRADRLTIVKQIFKWGHRTAKYLAANPLEGEQIPPAESKPQPCFTPDQVHTLLAKADPHEARIFAVMAYTGMRFGEVRDLEWSDFDFAQGNHGWVIVRRGGSNNMTKGKRSRRIPLNAELRRVLDGMTKGDGRVFFARPSKKFPNGDSPISERRLLVSLKRLCKRCGFNKPDQYKLHTFRHVFASMLARTHISYKYALSFMGHSSSDILDLYYQMFDKDAETAIGTIQFTPNATGQDRKAS
jgi:integrase